MDNNQDKVLNITLQKEEKKDNNLKISLGSIWRNFKRFFILWLVAAIVISILSFSYSAIFLRDKNNTLSALVSFTYSGIEKGLDPSGDVFDVNTIKSPIVIENALTKLGYSLEDLEKIRQNISIDGIIPSDAIDRITTYKSVYENASTGALAAAQEMLDVSYYPTQYKINLNYSGLSYKSDEAVQLFNTILECYRDYFFDTYGYNKALGSAVTALDYNDYDYAEAVDIFDSTLTSLRSYVNQLSEEDTTRFRSSTTGYTFSDLSAAIKTIQNMDLDSLSSYISLNNITKDKEALITYYQYRIDTLTREKTISEEKLLTITDSINTYQKDSVMIFGNGTDSINTNSSQASEEYDTLIKQKIQTQTDLSTAAQQINLYSSRLALLQSKPVGADSKVERVEADLISINDKVNAMIESVNATADEYYETVTFANAYNILVPASASAVSTIKKIINESMLMLLVLEALLLVVYICVSVIRALVLDNKKPVVAAVSEQIDDTTENEKDKK